MEYYWLLCIAFFSCLFALPKVIKRFKIEHELSDLLEIVGTVALAVAVVFNTIEIFV